MCRHTPSILIGWKVTPSLFSQSYARQNIPVSIGCLKSLYTLPHPQTVFLLILKFTMKKKNNLKNIISLIKTLKIKDYKKARNANLRQFCSSEWSSDPQSTSESHFQLNGMHLLEFKHFQCPNLQFSSTSSAEKKLVKQTIKKFAGIYCCKSCITAFVILWRDLNFCVWLSISCNSQNRFQYIYPTDEN